jgi:curved DNA-binding protein CbpA
MTDYFALFNQSAQPWLAPEVVKEKYDQLTRQLHPDVTAAGGDSKFEEINEAYRVLSDPRLRIQHLLALEKELPQSKDRVPPQDLQDLFLEVATLSQNTQRLFANMAGKSSPLILSMMKTEIVKLRSQTDPVLNKLQRSYEACLTELRRVDDLWKTNRSESIVPLRKVHDRMAYLARWIDQLKELQFQLSAYG